MSCRPHLLLFTLIAVAGPLACAAPPTGGAKTPSDAVAEIDWERTPDQGLQPQAAVDRDGALHLIYFQGDPAAGDVFYRHRAAGEAAFSPAIRVNTHPGSAIALGTIRGAQLAIGKGNRVHVVWNGSQQAQPRADDPKHDTPMMYTRLTDSGTKFEPERNLIRHAYGLDGGGSIAADERGQVYVAWHANPAADGESGRRVYLARSEDEGQSFAPETAISPEGTGVCACCGMKIFVDRSGRVLVLYRSATDVLHRDMYLLTSDDEARTFDHQIVDRWEAATCPMSSATFAEGPRGVVAGWETADQVFIGWDRGTGSILQTLTPGAADAAHPAVAVNTRGETLLVWTEGTGWKRGGKLAWQMYDPQGKPTTQRGSRDGVPAWSLATAVATADGDFTIIY